MVIDDLDVLWSFWGPHEADSPLIVDADAVLALAVANQSFKSVARRNPQVEQLSGGVEHAQLAQCRAFDVHPARNALLMEQVLCLAALEG
ncbi:hypothetical protein ASE31_29915 [Acidovorax sp. Root217]|nr:hypothetical protein ASE31_29915 [Acidovorax sp. Root217]